LKTSYTKAQIKAIVDKIKNQNIEYSVLSLFRNENSLETLNCQTFVILLLDNICGQQANVVLQLTIVADGTILY
jgi:ABC-type Zn uptake system ZnuABC Zn-binding protein ZnuA